MALNRWQLCTVSDCRATVCNCRR